MQNSSIVTRCPHCQTAFRVSNAQLSVAKGAVRCGSCLSIFKASDHEVTDGKPTPLSQPTKKQPAPKKAAASTQANRQPQQKVKPALSLDIDEELLQDNEKLDNEPISDDKNSEEGDDFYFFDKETPKATKTSSIFGVTKSKRITRATQEKADESWALDMLAELEEDDEELTLNFDKRRKKITEEEPTPSPTAKVSNPKAKRKPFTEKPVDLTPPEDTFENTINYEQLVDETDFNQTDLDNKPSTNDIINTNEEIEDLEFFYDESFEVSDDDYANHSISNDGFDEDLESLISDEEIDDAMDSAPSYKQELQGMIKGIQSAPVEMGIYEGENRRKWLWRFGVLLAALLLVAQVIFFRFESLSKHPTYRPILTQLCDVIGCQIPEWIALDQIRSNNLIVRNHPTAADALLVDVILINNARFEQPYPALSLEFSTIDNSLVAASTIQPEQYLRGELAGSRLMPAQQPIQVSLSIEDPGDTAVNYRLNLISAQP